MAPPTATPRITAPATNHCTIGKIPKSNKINPTIRANAPRPQTVFMCIALPPQRSIGGADRDRTGGLLVANQALSQLSYSPLTAASSRELGARFACSELVAPKLKADFGGPG